MQLPASRLRATLRGMGKEGPLDQQITIRATKADVARLEQLAELLSARTPGVEVTRTAAARAAILRGIEALESELAPKKKR